MDTVSGSITPGAWEQNHTPALERGLELVNGGELHKLVPAVRQTVSLTEPLDPQPAVATAPPSAGRQLPFPAAKRRSRQFLRGLARSDCLSLRNGQLRCDALAGTAGQNDQADLVARARQGPT